MPRADRESLGCGGGGGSAFHISDVGTKTAGSGTAPGNDTDTDRGSAGNCGAAGALNTQGSSGNPGRIAIYTNPR